MALNLEICTRSHYKTDTKFRQSNLSWNRNTAKSANPTCTGREIWCQNKQGIGIHSVKQIKNHQMGMKNNVE